MPKLTEKTKQTKVVAISDSPIVAIRSYIQANYNLRRNLIGNKLELDGSRLTDEDANDIYIATKIVHPKATRQDVFSILNSNIIPVYHPIKNFFKQNEKLKPQGLINSLADTLCTTNYEFTRHFVSKWLVSLIASVYGFASRLMLVLSGVQYTGKSEWFRRLLPEELRPYFGEFSAGIKDADLNILMGEKWILLDDEFEARRRKEETQLKSLLSKQSFNIRRPYGHFSEDLPRLAVLCGTSNEENLLSDATGNTRIIPVMVFSINQVDFNAIDKTRLLMEAYHLYQNGFNYQLTHDDLKSLADGTTQFQNYSAEYELIMQYIKKPQEGTTESMTATAIKNKLEILSIQKLSLDRIGKELKRLGFEQKRTATERLWQVYFPMTPNVSLNANNVTK